MSGNEGYDVSEGGSRKRVRTSKTGSHAVSHGPATPTVFPVDTPMKRETGLGDNGVAIPKVDHDRKEQDDSHAHDENCHHEQSLRTLHSDLEAMRHLITCKMCYRFLYEPYGLSCGHTYCYSCLAQWMCNSKTCPDCRAKVKEQPTPSFLVREMVRVFAAKSELLPDGETSEEHTKMAKEEAELVAKDRNNDDIMLGGLFRGRFRKGSRYHPVTAFRDDSDNVWRCPTCMNEVEDGRCGQCNLRLHTDGLDDFSGTSDSDDLDSELDGSLEDMDRDIDVDFGLDGTHFGPDGFDDTSSERSHAIDEGLGGYDFGPDIDLHAVNRFNDSDEDSEDSMDQDLEGFVDDEVRYEDDDSLAGTEEEAQTTPAQPSSSRQRRRARSAVVLSDSNSDSDDVEFVGAGPRRAVPVVPTYRRRLDRASSAGTSRDASGSEDESDDEPISNSQPNRRRAGRRQLITIDSDDDEGAEDSDRQPPDDGPQVDFSHYQGAFSPSSVQPGDDNSAWDTASEPDAEEQLRQMNAEAYGYDGTRDEDDEDNEDGEDDDDDVVPVPAPSRRQISRHTYDLDEDDNSESDDEDEGHSMTNGWAPSSTSRNPSRPLQLTCLPDSIREQPYRHRLHTRGPRRNRHRSPPPDHSSYYPQGNPRVQPTYRTNRIPRDVIARAAATARGATTYQPQHPFQLAGTLARLNADQAAYSAGRAAREAESEAADSDEEIARYASRSGSSGSSRTFQGDIAQSARAETDDQIRQRVEALLGREAAATFLYESD